MQNTIMLLKFDKVRSSREAKENIRTMGFRSATEEESRASGIPCFVWSGLCFAIVKNDHPAHDGNYDFLRGPKMSDFTLVVKPA